LHLAKKDLFVDMADEKKSGNIFGEILGCLILIIAIFAVLIWFILKPKLEEAGYSFTSISEKATAIKEKVSETMRNTTDSFQKNKEEAKETVENVKDTADEKVNEAKNKTPVYE
jgi:cytoskeletal protein RodZ